MNDKTRLRETLAQHAAEVDGAPGRPDRSVAVHQRIDAVRRRRRVGVVVAAVIGVVIAALAVLIPRQRVEPTQAPPRMVGHVVPRTTVSLGSTYTYVRGYVGHDGRLSVKLPSSDTDRLVRLASRAGQGQLLESFSVPTAASPIDNGRTAFSSWVSPAGDFGNFDFLGHGDSGTLKVSLRGGRGDVAVAVYRRTSPAPGYTKDGVTFASTVAGQPLLGAYIGDPGEDRHTFEVKHSDQRLAFHPYCDGVPEDTYLAVAAGGHRLMQISCDDTSPQADPGDDASGPVQRIPKGQDRLSISLARHGHALPVPSGARIGLGVYVSIKDRTRAGFPVLTEADGHRWRLRRVHSSSGRKLTPEVDATEPVLIAIQVRGRRAGSTLGWNGRAEPAISRGLSGNYILTGGRGERVKLTRKGNDGGLRIAVYGLAD